MTGGVQRLRRDGWFRNTFSAWWLLSAGTRLWPSAPLRRSRA